MLRPRTPTAGSLKRREHRFAVELRRDRLAEQPERGRRRVAGAYWPGEHGTFFYPFPPHDPGNVDVFWRVRAGGFFVAAMIGREDNYTGVREAGPIVLTASGEGLQPTTVTLTAAPAEIRPVAP